MSPTQLPPRKSARTRLHGNNLGRPLATAAAISFSLTFVAAGIALLFGLLPTQAVIAGNVVDVGVILLVVPLTALLFAIMAEVVRSTLRDGMRPPKPRQPNPLSAWRPGES